MSMKKIALRGLLIVAVVVALCIFFSGTVRTLTTPKVRFAAAKMGKMEQETELTGKVTFPEVEEFRIDVPEGLGLTVTRVMVAAGDQVKAGATMLTAKVTDGEKTLQTLKKDYATARSELRNLEKKTADIRLHYREQEWKAAWERAEEKQTAEREAWVNLQAALRQAGLALTEEKTLPEEAGEELQTLHEAWQTAAAGSAAAEKELADLDRFAIPEETWTLLRQQQEQEAKVADLENQMTALQVLKRNAEKITAPRNAYITEVSVEKGAAIDGDTVILKMTAEGSNPVIQLDVSKVKQEIKPGAALSIETESWGRPTTNVVNTGLTLEGRPYADAEINQDVIYALGNVGTMMKNDIKAKLVTRSGEATCLVPASAVRGSGDSRYVYIGQTDSSAFGGSRMTVRKMDVTVLAESGSTVSVAEDLTYLKVLYMEDRALTEGGTVMEYTKD